MTDEECYRPASDAASKTHFPSSLRPGKLVIPALRAALGSPAALIAYAVPLLLALVVLAAASALVLPTDSLVITNSAVEFVHSIDALPIYVALVLLAAHLANLFAMASASYVVIARLSGSDLRALDGWRAAARHWKRVLATGLFFAVLASLIGAIFFGLQLTGNPWIGLAIDLVLLFAIVPVFASWPIGLIVSGNPLWSVSTGWRVTRSASLYQSPRGAFTVWLTLSVTVDLALIWLTTLLPSTALVLAAIQLALTVAVSVEIVIGLTLLCSITLNGLKLLPEPVGLLPPPVRSVEARSSWLGAVAAIVAPTMLLLGFTTVNPLQITAVDSAQLGATIFPFTTVPLGSDSTLTLTQDFDGQFIECDPRTCEPTIENDSNLPVALAPLPNARVLLAQWRPVGEPGAKAQSFDLTLTAMDSNDLRVTRAREDGNSVSGDSTVILSVPTSDPEDVVSRKMPFLSGTQLAIDTSGEFPVIASVSIVDEPARQAATLDLYRCSTADCSRGTLQSSPVDWENLSIGAFQGLDLALRDDGTAFMSLVHDEGDSAELTLLVSRTDADLEVHDLSTPAATESRTSSESRFGTPGYGAQIVVNAEGNPTILHRALGETDLTLISCDDSSCATSTREAIPQLNESATSPALTIDASGRPLVAAFDRANRAVTLLSCDDSTCSTWTTRTLAKVDRPASDIALTLSADGRPIITANYITPATEVELARFPTVVLRCLQVRCGAD